MLGLKKKKRAKTKQDLSEKEVLEILEIPNFRHMTKDKIVEFTSQIPNMQPEVAKTALQQFPHFAKMASEVVSCYKDLVADTIKENTTSTKAFYDSCDTVIAALKSLIEKDNLKFRQKKAIIDNIMEILKMKSYKDSEQKEWLGNIVKCVSAASLAIVAIAGCVLGVNINHKD